MPPASAPLPAPGTPTQTASNGGDQTKLWAIIGYIIPILFFVPLLSEAKDNPFAKFHANQQLLLLIFGVGGYIIASLLVVVVIGVILYPIVMIMSLVFMVMGVIGAANGQMKPLPLIGKYTLLK